jgi:uncharacterized protein YecT (DUF1311 family)
MKNLFLLLALLPSLAFAEDCMQIPDYSKMVECQRNEATNLDKKLNSLYQSQIKKLSNDKKALNYYKQNQREWLKFASNYCNAKNLAFEEGTNGSFYPTAVNFCFADLTEQRIKQLNSFDCEEGDMSSTCIITSR